uniref:uncharacterized protein cd8b n=1 Tax=Scatophagus argus TaxID=75038 RepID=UPI001ED83A95|nr:uncharacterized protein cd8b [Scatophagus argus]
MILLPLAWTLWTVSFWTSGSSLILQQEAVAVFYPPILSTPVVDCECSKFTCNFIYWFRIVSNHSKLEFLGRYNYADRYNHGVGVNQARFKFGRRSSTVFTLHIINVTEEDAGVYSCVLKDRENAEVWKSGILLRPGGVAPTLPPTTKPKPPVKSGCRCTKKNSPQGGCGSLILWPLVGLIGALAVALLCILYYFSRLPKKCRHKFVKKRQMT